MRHVSVLRSTPLRIVLGFTALFTVSIAVAGTLTYFWLKNDLAERLDFAVRNDYFVLSASYGDNDLTDLRESVTSHASSNPNQDKVYLLLSKEGQRLAGNIAGAEVPKGLSTVQGSKLGLDSSDQYRVFSADVDGYPIIVGASFAESREFQRIAVNSFGWATFVILCISVVGGTILAVGVQRRMAAIAATMREIGLGKLEARIPLKGNGDDIDLLSVQINDALVRLSGLVEGMRQVSTDIAHDLKTPLQRLSLLIDETVSSNREARKTVPFERVKEEVARINATFDALLRIAQIEAGARKARFATVSVRDCIETIADVYADVAEDNQQRFDTHLPDNDGMIIAGDRELLIQLLANLVENSIRHCAAGSSIQVSAAMENNRVVVHVDDNGPGIPVEERDKVFRRLYRLDASRTTPGTGLGLSLVRAIADLHGATVTLHSNDPGLRVTSAFPRI